MIEYLFHPHLANSLKLVYFVYCLSYFLCRVEVVVHKVFCGRRDQYCFFERASSTRIQPRESHNWAKLGCFILCNSSATLHNRTILTDPGTTETIRPVVQVTDMQLNCNWQINIKQHDITFLPKPNDSELAARVWCCVRRDFPLTHWARSPAI